MHRQNYIQHISCSEYETRLLACKDDLDTLTLDAVYRDPNIVGDVLDADYVPELMPSGAARAKRAFGFWRSTSGNSERADSDSE